MIKIVVTGWDELQELIRSVIRQELGNIPDRPLDEKKYLNVSEASEFLKIPKSTLYQFTSKRLISFTLSGRRILFEKLALEQFLTSRRKANRSEIAEQIVTGKVEKK